jgi:large subunit ribosomal protein L15
MIHEITAATKRYKKTQRKGRGESSGRGKTSGRGNKAAHGGDPHWKPGHEGGQTPLFRRLPKRGFSNFKFENRFHIVNLSELDRFDNGATVDAAALKEAGLEPEVLSDGRLLLIFDEPDAGERLYTAATRALRERGFAPLADPQALPARRRNR